MSVENLSSLLWHSTPGAGPVPVSPKVEFPALDRAVLEFWDEWRVFQRSVSERPLAGKGDFVAYDGPPGTNGTPHIGHMMQSALKDLWPRYKTMQGYRVRRKAGWDTHGLPIELTAEKDLGVKTKRDIEDKIGVQAYIDHCRSVVFRFKNEWIEAIRRIGRFLDTDDDYATLTREYIETDWWVVKQAWDKGLLYQDRRIMPHCWRCGTSLSQHEAAQGYKDVTDLSLYVKFRLLGIGQETYFVAWTTTPWTLLSNVALAVNPELQYVEVQTDNGEHLVLAEERLEALKDRIGKHVVIKTVEGRLLNGKKYQPLWDFQRHADSHFIVTDDYVTAEDGTGIVHLALYGAEDLRIIRSNGRLPQVQNVDLNGMVISPRELNVVGHRVDEDESGQPIPTSIVDYTYRNNPFAGRHFADRSEDRKVKLLDLDILKNLADPKQHDDHSLLFGKEVITHSYPHCYRCDSPLMFFAKSGWFLKTTAIKDQMLAANAEINWFPDHIKEGRFGNWLENNVDWNISRERYWGSPLPIWECWKCGHRVCVESIKDLRRLCNGMSHPSLFKDDFDPHKPEIDTVHFNCPECAKGIPVETAENQVPLMVRVPEVLDCWFNAGIMPWGQWGYPAKPGSKEMFEGQFPADFICEALDQTRGWFYTMLATSVLITSEKKTVNATPPTPPSIEGGEFRGGKSSFKNVICTEFITDAQGQKMSKSKGNVVDPIGLCDKYGADAVRWNFYSVNPWTARRFVEADLAEGLRQMLIPYWNAYSFFVTYAKLDGWKPSATQGKPSKSNPLDRWILSRLVGLEETVRSALDGYDVARAAQAFTMFVDDLTNWHIRRSRRRFWKAEDDDDKHWAYRTLHFVLTTTNRMLAPFMPFVTEVIYQNLERAYRVDLPDSVHLAEWPQLDTKMRDELLEASMERVRSVVSIARSLRAEGGIRVRQPLDSMTVAANGSGQFDPEFEGIILDELNIKSIEYVGDASTLFSLRAKPNLKTLGPKLGSKLKEAARTVAALNNDEIRRLLDTGSLTAGGMEFAPEDLLVEEVAGEGHWVRSENGITVSIDHRLNDDLASEWRAREFVHQVQNIRKARNLEIADRIRVSFSAPEKVATAVGAHQEYIKTETLAVELVLSAISNLEEFEVGDEKVGIGISTI